MSYESEIDAVIGIGVISLLLTIITIIIIAFRLRDAPLKASLAHYLLFIQVAYLIADAFRLGRGIWMKLNTYVNQLAMDNIAIIHSQYISFAIETTCLTAMLFLTTLRFHIFSVVVDIYLTIALLVIVAAFVCYVILIALWASVGTNILGIFQNGREGHLLMACSIFMLVMTAIMLVCNTVAVWLTSRKAYRQARRKQSTIGNKESIKQTSRQKPPKAWQIIMFFMIGVILAIISLVVLAFGDTEAAMGIYGFFLRISQGVALVYVVILGKQWSSWMEALGQEKGEKEPVQQEKVEWASLAWAEADD